MIDTSAKLTTFYKNHVVLPRTEAVKLHEKKRLNIDRLKEGLKEYNSEYKTSYRIVEDIVQGSIAMSTVIQNDSKEYDIDIAVVFEKDNLPEGTTATKNIVVDALRRKCAQFNCEPEFKTNCVRIVYAEGYHIDLAIYRKKNDEYEHCGSMWRSRSPRAINQWFFSHENKDELRIVTRLLKTFSKSRDSWDMPGGLILTVLASECLDVRERIDETLYYTLIAIRNRLLFDKEVENPTDSSMSLLHKEKDVNRMNNLYTRLKDYLVKLEPLLKSDCSEKDAYNAWFSFFNHAYWSDLASKASQRNMSLYLSENAEDNEKYYDDVEEFIEDIYPVDIRYSMSIDCDVTQSHSKTIQKLSNLNERNTALAPGYKLLFHIDWTNAQGYDSVFWKVRNRGRYAEENNCLRGDISPGERDGSKIEGTSFSGNHYVECYIIKAGVCVARQKIDVKIAGQSA